MGHQAESPLRAALKQPPSKEAQQRLQSLLDNLTAEPGANELRLSRAVQTLELAGTSPARQVLEAWGRGASGARLTQEAAGAVERAGRRVNTHESGREFSR